MPIQHMKASTLAQKVWNAFCYGCRASAADADGDEALWTIWTSDMVYCPKCAKKEGIGKDDY